MSFRKVQVGNLLSTTTHFDDPLVTLNNSETGTNTSDIGIIMERGSASNVALLWDESEDTFVAIVTTHDGSTDGNVGISSYANLRAGTITGNLTGNVTGNVTGNITGDITGDVTGTVSDISNHDTDNLSEGSTNLYFTNARADARISASNTDNLSEGSSNQYFTNARARAALSATGSITYNSSTGVISYTAPTALSGFTNDSGFITSYTVTESDVTSHQSALSITESQISDFGSYLNDTGDNTITDTSTGSSAGPVVNLYRNNSSPGNANYLGQIKFQGKSSTGTTRTYAKITGKIADVTNGSEDGVIEFSVLDTGSNSIPVRINENGLYLNAGYTLKFEGPVSNTNELTLTSASLSADRTVSLPDATGTVALTSDIPSDTDSLSEGSSNLYFTNARADARITNAFSDAVSLSSTLAVAGNTTLSGTLTLPDADITFQDNNGTFPTSGKGFYWDLNNDEARIYAIQSASDYIDLVFKVSDNTNNQNDRWVFWLDGYQGQSSDAFPLTMTADNFYVFSDPSSTDGKPDLSNYKLHIPSGKTSSSTTTHKGRLGLHGDNSSDLYVRFENTSGNNAYIFQDQSDSNNFKMESHNDICFNTSGANERMVINSSGRVGIGTDPYSDANFHIRNGDVGLEFSLDGAVSDEARLLSYDRSANTRRGMVLDGDHLDFRTGGTSRLLVNSSGNTNVYGRLGIDQDHASNAVIRGDGLNGAFQHGRYGHTLIQNKNHSTSNYWGLSPRDGGNMEISYGAPNSYGSLTSGAIMSFTTAGRVGIGTQTPEATLHIVDEGSTGPGLHISGGSSTEGDITVPHDENLQIGHWNESTDTFTQRIHMDTNGHVGIGTTSPADASWSHSTYGNTEFCIDGNGGYGVLHMRGDGAGSSETRFSSGVGDGKYYMAYDDVNTTHRITVLANGNVGIGNTGAAARLHVTGGIYATGDVTAYYSSDINLKENVVDIENALDKVKQIRGVRYDWKDEYLEEHTYVEKQDVGVIAQEVEKVLPEIVADREDGTKAVKYDRLTALLIEAVKELSAKVDAQQEEINILKGKHDGV